MLGKAVEELVHSTKIAPHLTIAFFTETKSCEVFQCYMKSNTLAETVIQTPNHCVKSVKQTCRLI